MNYFKTDKGRAEIAERSHALTVVQRRLLIVIDGHRTVNDLGAFVRVDELDGALEWLQHEGLIESTSFFAELSPPAAPGYIAASPSDSPRPATSPQEFEKVRQQASSYVLERLGPSGEPICGAIERCTNPADLRRLLRGVEVFIGERLSPDTTQEFARHFGALLL